MSERATGVGNFDDLKASPQTADLRLASARSTPTGYDPRRVAATGLPIKIIYGYGSTTRSAARLGARRIDGVFRWMIHVARRQDLLTNRIVVPILKTSQPSRTAVVARRAAKGGVRRY